MREYLIGTGILISFFVMSAACGNAQLGFSFDLKKPQKFENRKLGSEKNVDKKFTLPRKFTQNTFSHYNYFFNANEKIKSVLSRTKLTHKDDYGLLLPFYGYTLAETSLQRTDLDSVIYKATAGILLHDLRSSWVDNFYLLMGQAYYYRNQLDSAYLTFQFLNYAFSPKEKDGYDKVIGSNANEGGSVFSIATNEKRTVVKKVFSRPPSRNESLLWQIKTYLANKELAEATSLIQTLTYDPFFPGRLRTDLAEVQAWYFYQQNIYDSAAFYLQQALPNAQSQAEQARWEFLIAQLYELSQQPDFAKTFYKKANQHSIDPVLEVYALMNAIRQSGTDSTAIQSVTNQLKKMARKDKYFNYRDILYYAAAQTALQQKDSIAAQLLLKKSIANNVNNPTQKSKSFLLLADVSLALKNFVVAKPYYDSVDASIFLKEERDVFIAKRQSVALVAQQQEIIATQDSLQKLAALPEAERNAFVKKLLKQLRKQQGLKEEEPTTINTGENFNNNNNSPAAVDIFAASNTKGDWYFYNQALKSKGFSEFRAKWGNRPNVDNWRRIEAVRRSNAANRNIEAGQLTNAAPATEQKPLTLEALEEDIPTTPEKIKQSNEAVMKAWFELGKALQNGLEDYPLAITAYETLLDKFPATPAAEEALFHLHYCYKKMGMQAKAEATKMALSAKYTNGKLSNLLSHPETVTDSSHKKDGAVLYNDIYNLFIEGKFLQALTKKQMADSAYGKHFFTPQLLYIEAVYHIQQRNDSVATLALKNILQQASGTPMAVKAQKLLDVLPRRKQIEAYLTKLEVPETPVDTTPLIDDALAVKSIKPSVVKKDTIANNLSKAKPVTIKQKPTATPTIDIIKTTSPKATNSSYTLDMQAPHVVMLVMNKVDPVYINEAKNAFTRYHKEKYYNHPLEVQPITLSEDTHLLLFSSFESASAAIAYIEKSKPLAAAEIMPWMPIGKYSFLIISNDNLKWLMVNKNIAAYQQFLSQNYPGIFK
jgi:hypothetical protein